MKMGKAVAFQETPLQARTSTGGLGEVGEAQPPFWLSNSCVHLGKALNLSELVFIEL